MTPSIYLINPKSDFPTYFAADAFEAWGLKSATQMADPSITTVAAFADRFMQVEVCDQMVGAVNYDHPATVVGITGKITQLNSMIEIAREFRARGKLVVIGGPLASLAPDRLRSHCDVLIRNEIEEIADELFSDLAAGRAKSEYIGGKPDLSLSPIPRWSAYPNARAIMGTVQTSRGCPFECEFCDVIVYVGRKQRHKEIAQVIAELDVLYGLGYRRIFLADDNFTVVRARARELLTALKAWNAARVDGKVRFVTQVSIDVARDDEMLALAAAAGLTQLFIGLETPNEASLREAKKRQNLRRDLVDEVANIYQHGINVVGGMIVGFDADGADIFERQFAFAMDSAIPIFSLGALVAPVATPLHARLRKANRLNDSRVEVAATPFMTNVIHPTLSQEDLIGGLRWLANALYSPENFGTRLVNFVERLGPRRDPSMAHPISTSQLRRVEKEGFYVISRLRRLGDAEQVMWTRVLAATMRKPQSLDFVLDMVAQYMQIRFMYASGRFWDPQLGVQPAPRVDRQQSMSGLL